MNTLKANPITVAVVSALLSGLLVSVGWSFHGAQRLTAVETTLVNIQRQVDRIERHLELLRGFGPIKGQP